MRESYTRMRSRSRAVYHALKRVGFETGEASRVSQWSCNRIRTVYGDVVGDAVAKALEEKEENHG